MRHMSFALTTPQVLARTKTVTRRLGWEDLKPGTVLQAVEKGQGLKKGEKVRKLAVIRVVTVTREVLQAGITQAECDREGFPHLSPLEFLSLFCRANVCDQSEEVTRIAFEYVDEGRPAHLYCPRCGSGPLINDPHLMAHVDGVGVLPNGEIERVWFEATCPAARRLSELRLDDVTQEPAQ